jgi:TATA-binding protein-associated factor
VKSVVAETLLPVVNVLVKKAPKQTDEIIDTLWGTLLQLDELSSSTSAVMKLLGNSLFTF